MSEHLPILEDEDLASRGEQGLGCLSTARGNLPVRRVQVDTEIDGLVASIVVRQTFVNSLPGSDASDGAQAPNTAGEALEATFIFPLPDRAAVTHFEMQVGGRVVAGELRERGAARREYEAAISQGHRAAIAEEDRANVFSLRVGNILPGEEAAIRLELSQPIPVSDGEATFQFPLVVAPRYIPGAPLSGPSVGAGTAYDTDAVPDASRITPPVLLPGFPNPVEFAMAVVVRPGGLKLDNFRSSLHTLREEALPDGSLRLTVAPGERLNRDFLLRYRVAEHQIQSALQCVQDAGPDATGGTFQVTIVPPGGAAPTVPRDVVFIVDRSGSMKGWKIVAARRAVCRMIDTLGAADRFTVVAFSKEIHSPPQFAAERLEYASDRRRFQAIEYLAGLNAAGGTELQPPLVTGLNTLKQVGDSRRQKILVLITDGQVGNEDELLQACGTALADVRMYALGIDTAVNMGLLNKLVQPGGGRAEIVESEYRLDSVLIDAHRRMGAPVLLDLQVDLPDCEIDHDSFTPRRPPDLFAGVPLVIRGRFRGTPPERALVRALDPAGQRCQLPPIQATEGGRPVLQALWARDHLRALEDTYFAGPSRNRPLAQQIVDCSLASGVLCRFTAYFAVDRSEIANAGGARRQIVQPVEWPESWQTDDVQQFGGSSHRIYADEMSLRACATHTTETFFDLADNSLPFACNSWSDLPLSGSDSRTDRKRLSFEKPIPKPPSEYRALVRQQAQDLLAFGRRLVASNVARVMSHLLFPFRKIVTDLERIPSPAEIVAPLRALLTEVEQVKHSPQHEPQSRALWQRIENALEALIDQLATAQSADPAPEFWK